MVVVASVYYLQLSRGRRGLGTRKVNYLSSGGLPRTVHRYKKKIKFSSYIRKFRMEQLQIYEEYMRKCANI